MSMRETYMRKCQQLRADIASLQKKRAGESKKAAEASKKANDAAAAAQRATSDSTRRTKERELERQLKSRERAEADLATIDGKIARKENELASAMKSLSNEEERESKKRAKQEQERLRKEEQRHKEAAAAVKARERQLAQMSRRVDSQEIRQAQTERAIDELQRLPERIVVLFLAANPLDQEQLRLDEEVRAIRDTIRKSEHRDVVALESRWAVRPIDVLQAVNELQPHIVHFSGHGSEYDEIVLMDDHGESKFVAKQAIVQAMVTSGDKLRLVFFNTCYSSRQAEAVVSHVEAAIGMTTEISDDAARVFAAQFYSVIGFGKSVAAAFQQARALLMMEGIEEEDTPELFTGAGVDPKQLVIVRPPSMAL